MKFVFIHGRSQQEKDPVRLKAKWVSSLATGAQQAGLDFDFDYDDFIFPYFGNTLMDLTSDASPADMRNVVLHNNPDGPARMQFRCKIVNECIAAAGVTEDVVQRHTADPSKGPLTWEWVQTGLSLLDRYVPGASSRSVAFSANDVAQYLEDDAVRHKVDTGVATGFEEVDPAEEVVVIAHSLGTLVAYSLLRPGGVIGRPIRSLITLGSPLGLRTVRNAFSPLAYPYRTGPWFNAFDQRDVVALHPLDGENFDVAPAVINYDLVRNGTHNHHGITGYLSDPTVARKVLTANDVA